VQQLINGIPYGSIEVFTETSFEERNDIYVREVIDLGEALEKSAKKPNGTLEI
jgi:hypothetical protein